MSESTERVQRLREELSERGLALLAVRFARGDDGLLGPILWEVGAGRSRDGAAVARGGGHLGAGWLLVSADRLVLRPDSPWELGEGRALGLEVVDPREAASREDLSWLEPWLRAAGGEGIGVAGLLEAAAWKELTARIPADRQLEPCDGILQAIRRPRTPAEVERIGEVAAVSDRAFVEVARRLAAAVPDADGILWLGGEPLTVGTLRAAVGLVVAGAGFSQPEGNLIAAGQGAADPHHGDPDEHRIRTDEPVLVDLFPRSGLYSDCTRTFCVVGAGGGGPESWRRAARDVVDALRMAERTLEETLAAEGEASAFDLHRRVCSELRHAGWPTQLDEGGTPGDEGFVHGLGHGVGHELHEAPWFHDGARGTGEGTIVEGDVLTLEPGLYRPGSWGVRFEDLYVVEASSTEAGATLRRLTRLPRTWDPREFLAALGQA